MQVDLRLYDLEADTGASRHATWMNQNSVAVVHK